ncbi:MAG: excisionase family DNA-binding protein [Acidimicrobiales bacterium]
MPQHTPREVARKKGCAEITVYRAIYSGRLRTTRPDGRHHLISDLDFQAFMA